MCYVPENLNIFNQIFSLSRSDKGEYIQNILVQIKHSSWFKTTGEKKANYFNSFFFQKDALQSVGKA